MIEFQLEQPSGVNGQDIQCHLQLRDGLANFRMLSDLLLQFLQNLVSTRNVRRCFHGTLTGTVLIFRF